MPSQDNTPHEETMLPDLSAFAAGWDAAAYAARSIALGLDSCRFCRTSPCQCPPPPAPRVHATAQMLRDIWQDDNGPQRVASLLARLPAEERNRLCVDYWNLLRRSGCHEVSLHEVGIQFELAMLRAA